MLSPPHCPKCQNRRDPPGTEMCEQGWHDAGRLTLPAEWLAAAGLFMLTAVQSSVPPEARVQLIHSARAALRGDSEAFAEYRAATAKEASDA